MTADPKHTTPLVLASASPRRADLLRLLGHPFEVFRPSVDESLHPGERPAEAVQRLARDKAAAGRTAHPDAVVIAADTLVALDGESLGKPRDVTEAAEMLRRLAGRTHQVFTGFAVSAPSLTTPLMGVTETAVHFRSLSAAEISAYARSAEPLDKAGAYAIQGRAAAFVDRIEGSYTNVVGLPLSEVSTLLARVGLEMSWR